MIFCFDLDETLCTSVELNYMDSRPIKSRIQKVNQLFNEGHVIKIHTARGSQTGIDWTEVTRKQLEEWGLKFHELYFGKPFADFYIDDKAVNCIDFVWE